MTNNNSASTVHLDDEGQVPFLKQGHIRILAILAMIEIISAFYLAWLNPVRGYDENWYLINAYRFQGITSLPYAFNRPPILSMLIAIFGDFRWMISAFSHIGSTLMIFLILRRFVTPAMAIGGTIVFMICGDLRIYNMMMLTEMPTILFMLLTFYYLIRQKAFLVGLFTTLSFMTHWSMATSIPVFIIFFAMNKHWRPCLYYIAGIVFTAAPLLWIASMYYGNPLVGALVHFSAQQNGVNDWMYYLRSFPQLPISLLVGGMVSVFWVWKYWDTKKGHPVMVFCVLMLGLIIARMTLLQTVSAKGSRYLIPMIPLLMLLSIMMIDFFGHRGQFVKVCLWVALIITVMPNKVSFYQMYSLATDPTHLIDQFQDDVAKIDSSEPIYTDFHDIAVMGHLARNTFPVISDYSWHHREWDLRQPKRREDIPNGALYMTWDPEGGEILATSEKTKKGRLCLVRWKEGSNVRKVSYP